LQPDNALSLCNTLWLICNIPQRQETINTQPGGRKLPRDQGCFAAR
jgi:hypothetical protein